MLDRHLVLDPQVALRREPFGALAYHYGTRRLIFLKHPDLVRVVEALPAHDTVADALAACGIAESRWPSFVAGLESLERSGLLTERLTVSERPDRSTELTVEPSERTMVTVGERPDRSTELTVEPSERTMVVT